MTYLEKVLSAIKFDESLFKADEIERLREIIGWQIQDQLCPSDIAFLGYECAPPCRCLCVNECKGQCWDTEAAANE